MNSFNSMRQTSLARQYTWITLIYTVVFYINYAMLILTACFLFFVQGSLIPSLVSRHRPAFCRFQYRKQGEPGIFSHMSMTYWENAWRKFAELTACVSCTIQLTTRSMLGVYDSCLLLARYVRYGTLVFFYCSGPCVPTHN